jgi:hypothetical protein
MSNTCNSKSYPVDFLATGLIRHQISLKLSAKALLTEQSSLRLEVRDVTNEKIGAILAFLTSRFILRDWVKNTFAKKLESDDKGIKKDGAFYLLSLRLVPLFPFFIINLVWV